MARRIDPRHARGGRPAFVGAAVAAAAYVLLACVPPTCQDCPPTSGVSGHSAAFRDKASREFHGTVVKEAGFDYTRAKWLGLACSICHAGKSPDQASPVRAAPSCYAYHKGGPDGSPGHPAGFMEVAHPAFHGRVVREAGYDYKRALAGTIPCADCHAGEDPRQRSLNSRAPNCFFCHSGGPDGSAAHPIGWGDTAGPRLSDYPGPASCAGCHGSLPSPRPDAPHPPALAFDAGLYTGLAGVVALTVVDPGANRDPATAESLVATLRSEAEPAGEQATLIETTPGSGTFVGSIRLERVFAADGSARQIASNGRIAAYAEGGVATASLTATYGALGGTALYTEPPSTVTGIVSVGGVPSGGSGLVLSGGALSRSTTSRSDGSYAFHDVPPGTYTLVAARNGARQFATTVTVPQEDPQ
ncbi:MAG: carboxypeptidase regulatory-like domain-containing protein [Candidatus Sericytochromatia bacterium]|nr:carboxypeptidase regulatory-like domain-containing protein [Candidatus Tanganyikabacteria bacterium]